MLLSGNENKVNEILVVPSSQLFSPSSAKTSARSAVSNKLKDFYRRGRADRRPTPRIQDL